MSNSEKILVTGGAGSVGVYLARRLAQQGKEVVIADNFFRGKRDVDLTKLLALPNVTLIEGDLTTRAGWDALGTGYAYVYQLAGVNGTKLFYEMPGEVLRIGVTTILHSLEWLKDTNPTAKILYTSSNEAYAGALAAFDQLPIPTPENVPLVISDTYNPRWTYGGTKLIGELFYIHYAKEHGLRSVIVRPHNFYGPRTGYDHVIPEFIERIQKRVDPFPINGADDTRTFCFMEDAVEAMQMVMESEKTDGGTYHIGRPYTDELSMKDLAEKLFDITGWRPQNLEINNGPEGSVKRRAADITKIKTDVGWEAKVSLEKGLTRTLAWYNEHPNPKKK
jgi:nucleoside-diphosphate-sugar epimerase